MDYKPYSMEWNRKRYLAESIQQYFDTNASLDTVLDDIVDVLEQNVSYHKNRAEKFQEVLDGLKSLPY
jgi:arylsulfatase A-like enzyme